MERLISEGDYNQNRKSGSKQDIAVLMKLRFTFTKCLTKLQNVIINRIQRRGGGGGEYNWTGGRAYIRGRLTTRSIFLFIGR